MKIEGLLIANKLSDDILTLNLGGTTIIEHTIRNLMKKVAKTVVLSCSEIVWKIASSYYNIEVVDSLSAGLLKINSDKIVIVPANYPLIKEDSYDLLLKQEGDLVIPTFNGIKGYPKIVTINPFTLNKIAEIPINDEGITTEVNSIADYYQIYLGRGAQYE